MQTVTYPQCEGCGKALEKSTDGVVLWGIIYRAVPAPQSEHVLVGTEPPTKMEEGEEYDYYSAWCFKCLHAKMQPEDPAKPVPAPTTWVGDPPPVDSGGTSNVSGLPPGMQIKVT
jgi:hypothetical protein